MNRYLDYLHDVLITVHANLHDLHEKRGFADPEELDYLEGRIIELPGSARHSEAERAGVWHSGGRTGNLE